jgi:hypothetical protein
MSKWLYCAFLALLLAAFLDETAGGIKASGKAAGKRRIQRSTNIYK